MSKLKVFNTDIVDYDCNIMFERVRHLLNEHGSSMFSGNALNYDKNWTIDYDNRHALTRLSVMFKGVLLFHIRTISLTEIVENVEINSIKSYLDFPNDNLRHADSFYSFKEALVYAESHILIERGLRTLSARSKYSRL